MGKMAICSRESKFGYCTINQCFAWILLAIHYLPLNFNSCSSIINSLARKFKVNNEKSSAITLADSYKHDKICDREMIK